MDEFLGLNARRYLNPGKSLHLVCELIALWEGVRGQLDEVRIRLHWYFLTMVMNLFLSLPLSHSYAFGPHKDPPRVPQKIVPWCLREG